MKIQDRIIKLENVVHVHWNGKNNRLVVYYKNTSLDTIAVRVVSAIGEAGLQRAIEKITFIGQAKIGEVKWKE